MPTQTTSVGVSLSWEPFDWGRKKHEAAEKSAHRRPGAARAAGGRKLGAGGHQRQVPRSCVTAARSFAWPGWRRKAAMENLRVAKNKYLVQAVLVKDVLQAQVSLEQSNTDYQQALASFWNARADFERALGEDQ